MHTINHPDNPGLTALGPSGCRTPWEHAGIERYAELIDLLRRR